MGERAVAFASRLSSEFDIHLCFRSGGRLASLLTMWREVSNFRPELCYVLDMAFCGVAIAGLCTRIRHVPFIVDTGDAIVELGRAMGRRNISLWATRQLESFALSRSDKLVVRGSFHAELLSRRGIKAEFIPDGADIDLFAPTDISTPQKSDRTLVIGLVGACVWSPTRNTCYGAELVELIRLLNEKLIRPVRGVIIGDGSGLEVLKERSRQYGIERQIEFVGWVPFADLPRRLREFDICLSTQSNDIVGQVRTTGKLPIYLAAGRFILASKVGEAAKILPSEMLVDFAGDNDPDYATKLAERVIELIATGTALSPRRDCVDLARSHFAYDLLSRRLANLFHRIIPSNRRLSKRPDINQMA